MAETPDFKEMIRMAKELEKSMKEAHTDLSRQQYTGEAGGVKVIVDGRHQFKDADIDSKTMPKLEEEERKFLADLFVAAANAAGREIEKASERKMRELTKKLGVPGKEE